MLVGLWACAGARDDPHTSCLDASPLVLPLPVRSATPCCAGIVGVRFKRLIMDDTGLMPKSRAPRPPEETNVKWVVAAECTLFLHGRAWAPCLHGRVCMEGERKAGQGAALRAGLPCHGAVGFVPDAFFCLCAQFITGTLPFPPHRRVVFCSGKVYYDLHAEREKQGLDKEGSVAVVRVEQVRGKAGALVSHWWGHVLCGDGAVHGNTHRGVAKLHTGGFVT